jgi:glycosyltransferase involved in cell wall biosynthesis
VKVLLLHNRYGAAAPSGENVAFDADRRLLEAGGATVELFERSSDELRGAGVRGAVRGALAAPWSRSSARRVRELVTRGRHEVAHVHNFFPLLSPAVFPAARAAGAATVFTLHNARIFCAAGVPLREGRPCTACLDRRSALPGLRHGCYRGSRAATLPLAAMIALHRARGTWLRDVDAFIVLTGFQRELMAGAGLPIEKLHVAPPCYPDAPDPAPFAGREAKAVFVGRLGAEKGVDVLLRAWARWGAGAPTLEIVGAGPQGEALRRLAGELGLAGRVLFAGQLPFAETQRRIAAARLLLLPSLCFEGFPMTLREAMALGVPMAGSRRGAIPWIIREGETGVLFEPGDPEDLASRVAALWADGERLERMAGAARAEFDGRYGFAAAGERLLRVYESAVRSRRGA